MQLMPMSHYDFAAVLCITLVCLFPISDTVGWELEEHSNCKNFYSGSLQRFSFGTNLLVQKKWPVVHNLKVVM